MATTSDKRSRYDSSDGLFTAVQDDPALFGSGTIAARPATGDHDGDFYVVLDQANQIFRIDRWSATNSAWMVALHRSTSDPTSSDDQASGFYIGSMWVNTSSGAVFICTSATPSLAVWAGTSDTRHQTMVLTSPVKVPGQGTLYLRFGEVSTGDVPASAPATGNIKRLFIQVDVADSSRSYDVEVVVEGSVAETVNLPVSTQKTSDVTLSASVTAGDDIQVRLVRDTGSGSSSFDLAIVALVIQEAA